MIQAAGSMLLWELSAGVDHYTLTPVHSLMTYI